MVCSKNLFKLLTKSVKTICSLTFSKCLVVLRKECTWEEGVIFHVLTNFTIFFTLCFIFIGFDLKNTPFLKLHTLHKLCMIYIIYILCIIMFIYIRPYYARLAFVRFEHSVCRGSLMTTYIYVMKDKIYRVIHFCVGACRTLCFCKRELYKHL